MNNSIEILKGIHPGVFLARELKRRGLQSGKFAESIGEHPQTISAIIRGRRSMNIPLSLQIEHMLNMDEGFLMTLQVFYDIEQQKRQTSKNYHPDLSKYRNALFWDTSIDKLDWQGNKAFIINRVFERGNGDEIQETISFYGRDVILSTLKLSTSPWVNNTIQNNIDKYLNDGIDTAPISNS